jgi:hypothetical protein
LIIKICGNPIETAKEIVETGGNLNVGQTALLGADYAFHVAGSIVKGVCWDLPIWVTTQTVHLTAQWIGSAYEEAARNCTHIIVGCS